MHFLLVTIFFSLIVIICLSWYLHLKLFDEVLTIISFNIWRQKCQSIKFSHLEPFTRNSESQMVFLIIYKVYKVIGLDLSANANLAY